MATIHTNNYNLAELIIKPTITDPTQCWKTVYHTISVPEEIRQFLSIDDNRDFSFILYLIAIWLDKAHDLKTLYKKKIPTALGQGFLIYKGLENNARNCFKMLLKKQNTKDIIKKRQIMYFKSALETKNKYFPKKLLKKKLFSLNGTIVNFGKITILDHYYNDEKLKDRNEIINLLLSLGAKTWNELERERRH